MYDDLLVFVGKPKKLFSLISNNAISLLEYSPVILLRQKRSFINSLSISNEVMGKRCGSVRSLLVNKMLFETSDLDKRAVCLFCIVMSSGNEGMFSCSVAFVCCKDLSPYSTLNSTSRFELFVVFVKRALTEAYFLRIGGFYISIIPMRRRSKTLSECTLESSP